MAHALMADPVPLRWSADGALLVGTSRVPLETVVECFTEGATAEEIALRYDALTLADIYAVIGYYLRHRQELEAYLRRAQRERDAVRQQLETQFPSAGIRERLLARRAARQSASEALAQRVAGSP
jgi:uncharacterized protein (DUF433 family)